MTFQFHIYIVRHVGTKSGKTKVHRISRASDNEIQIWVQQLVERSGGSAEVVLQDGSKFTWPKP
jgi:hypothetical protein